MASTFLPIPVKKTSDVDLVKPIRAFIVDAYTDLKPADYNNALIEFNKLRSMFVAKLSEKPTEGSLELLYRFVL